MNISKTQYILKSLKKIAHKQWELFIISRILHNLDDDEIEFKTQQLIRRNDGSRALTDLYFPQLGLHLEIDEPHHNDYKQKKADEAREQDILTITGHKIERIKVARAGDPKKAKEIQEIRADVDAFTSIVQRIKNERLAKGAFTSWNFEKQYSADQHISKGHISIKDNVVFKTQAEALRCFGFTGKGWQKGTWRIPDGSCDIVWFPRLYEHGIWKNELSNDGKTILEVAKNHDGVGEIKKQRIDSIKNPDRKFIVFAKAKDSLGFNLLRYVGTFAININESSPYTLRFDRISDIEEVRIPAGQ